MRALRLALLEALLPGVAVAADGGDQLLRERVDDAGADAVQAARGLVVLALELAAGVEHREDDLEGALAGLRMLVDGDAAAVVGDGERRIVLVQRDDDRRRVAVHGLVDGVVEDLPGEVVQAVPADAADVHAGALADGLEPLQDGDVFRGVAAGHESRPSVASGRDPTANSQFPTANFQGTPNAQLPTPAGTQSALWELAVGSWHLPRHAVHNKSRPQPALVVDPRSTCRYLMNSISR